MENNVKYARKCSVTGEGMNEGYVWRDAEMYFKYEKDLIRHIRSLGDEEFNKASDKFLLKESYNEGECYWTQWECPEDYEYEMINGILTEIEK